MRIVARRSSVGEEFFFSIGELSRNFYKATKQLHNNTFSIKGPHIPGAWPQIMIIKTFSSGSLNWDRLFDCLKVQILYCCPMYNDLWFDSLSLALACGLPRTYPLCNNRILQTSFSVLFAIAHSRRALGRGEYDKKTPLIRKRDNIV